MMFKLLSSRILQKKAILFISVLICAYFSSSITAIDELELVIYEKWSYENSSSIVGIYDLNADGLYEILINSPDENLLICLNYAGEELWNYPILENPSVINGNISKYICDELVVVSSLNAPIKSNLISCLNYKGEIIWEKIVDFERLTPLDIINLDDDENEEIVIFSENSIYIYDEVGVVENIIEIGEGKTPIFIDYEDDSFYDFLFKIEDSFLCYNLTGDLLWNYTIVEPDSESRRTELGPVLSDFTRNGQLEVLYLYSVERGVLDANILLHLNSSGNVILEQEIIKRIITDTSCIRDLNTDGILDFTLNTFHKEIHCVSIYGDLIWSNEDYYSGNCCPKLNIYSTDIVGDNNVETLVNLHTDDNGLIFLDSEGIVLKKEFYPRNNWIIKAIMDFDIDGYNDLLVEEKGIVCLYGINGAKAKATTRGYEHNPFIQEYNYLDQDFDFLSDLHETIRSCSINDSDTDNDSFLDGWEIQVGLNPLFDDSGLDSDNDGITNLVEITEYHTSIFLKDTDEDGILDINDKVEIKSPAKTSFRFIPIFTLSSFLIVLVFSRFSKRKTEANKK